MGKFFEVRRPREFDGQRPEAGGEQCIDDVISESDRQKSKHDRRIVPPPEIVMKHGQDDGCDIDGLFHPTGVPFLFAPPTRAGSSDEPTNGSGRSHNSPIGPKMSSTPS